MRSHNHIRRTTPDSDDRRRRYGIATKAAFLPGLLHSQPILVSRQPGIGGAFRVGAVRQHPEMVFGLSCSIYRRSLNG
jgi:hypothetical protein